MQLSQQLFLYCAGLQINTRELKTAEPLVKFCAIQTWSHWSMIIAFRYLFLVQWLRLIGRFWVHFSLYFKANPFAKSLLRISVFIHIEIRTDYHNRNLTLRLPLKDRTPFASCVYKRSQTTKTSFKFMTHIVCSVGREKIILPFAWR